MANWARTELGKNYEIYVEDGEMLGQQYPTDTGRIDLLAVRRDGNELLVVELKKGRASDIVVGQVLRYMGYVKHELAEQHQTVKGAIVASDGDQRIKRALDMVDGITLYRCEVQFDLRKAF